MVQKVDTPAEHFLINSSQFMVESFLRNTLMKFSVQRLLDTGIASRTLKSGLDFTDAFKNSAARAKLNTYLWTKAIKDIPFIGDQHVTPNSLAENTGFLVSVKGSPNLTLVTLYDNSVERYIRRLRRKIVAADLHIELTIRRDLGRDKMEITVSPPRLSQDIQYYKSYKLLFFIEDFLTVIRTLSRKSRFIDEDVKTLTRSRHSGFGRGQAAVDNRRAEELASRAAEAARETRRYR